MKHMTLVFATPGESAMLREAGSWEPIARDSWQLHKAHTTVTLLHTGLGIASTAYHLGFYLATHKTDLVVNLGIAGAIDRSIPLGSVVEVAEECFADMGAEDQGRWLSLKDMGFPLLDKPRVYNQLKNEQRSSLDLPRVKGVTVNTVHGARESIETLKARWPGYQVESMEGAACLLACLKAGIPCLQFRAISNYVEPRNRASWQIPEALNVLTDLGMSILERGVDRLVS